MAKKKGLNKHLIKTFDQMNIEERRQFFKDRFNEVMDAFTEKDLIAITAETEIYTRTSKIKLISVPETLPGDMMYMFRIVKHNPETKTEKYKGYSLTTKFRLPISVK